jgi:hypothetical protein
MTDGKLRMESNREMTPQPYQNAYDTALAELTEIAAKFEELRARKTLLESAILALEPFFASSEAGITPNSSAIEAENHPVPTEQPAAEAEAQEGYSFEDVPSPLPDIAETGGDPFQRRGKSSYRFRGFATQRSF